MMFRSAAAFPCSAERRISFSTIRSRAAAWERWWTFFRAMKTRTTAGWSITPTTTTSKALAETGLLGGLCGVAFLWALWREGRKNFRAEQGHFSRGLHAGAIMAVCGLLLHSFVDFNLQIPSNALLFLLQAYLVTSPPLPSDAGGSRDRRRIEDLSAAVIAVRNGREI